jgi:hypothetical protein
MSYNNVMVAHLWAQREKDNARSSNGSMSFQGATLYSYSTPIGRFIGEATLVTSRHYSRTTSSKHMTALWCALRYGEKDVFTVPNVSPVGKDEHKSNLDYLVDVYKARAASVQRIRDYYGGEADLARELSALADKARRYAKLFKLRCPLLAPEGVARDVMTKRAERAAKANTPAAAAAAAKREKARAAREAKEARRVELERAESAERVEAWKRGEPVQLRHGERLGGTVGERGTALLRVRGSSLETSLGATVPLEHAVRVFRFVKLCRERGEAWQRNGRSLRVGHFQVDSVDANGDFTAGCHFIAWPETEAAAIAAGVADLASEDTRDLTAAA